jgi:hypothetical protein
MIADRKLLSEADVDGQRLDQADLLYPLAIDNGHTCEEVFQLDDVLFDR